MDRRSGWALALLSAASFGTSGVFATARKRHVSRPGVAGMLGTPDEQDLGATGALAQHRCNGSTLVFLHARLDALGHVKRGRRCACDVRLPSNALANQLHGEEGRGHGKGGVSEAHRQTGVPSSETRVNRSMVSSFDAFSLPATPRKSREKPGAEAGAEAVSLKPLFLHQDQMNTYGKKYKEILDYSTSGRIMTNGHWGSPLPNYTRLKVE